MRLTRLFVVVAVLAFAPLPAFAGAVAGVILSVTGEVTVRDDKARRMPVETGMAVEIGHMIKTRDESTVRRGWPTARSSPSPRIRPSCLMTSCLRARARGA